MSNIIDLLIRNANSIQKPQTKELEVSRLSAITGEKFKITVRALTMSEFDSFPQGENARLHSVIKGIISPSLKDEQLRKAYTPENRKNMLTPKELVQELFTPGEIANIGSEILALSGFNEEAIIAAKTIDDIENAEAIEVAKN